MFEHEPKLAAGASMPPTATRGDDETCDTELELDAGIETPQPTPHPTTATKSGDGVAEHASAGNRDPVSPGEDSNATAPEPADEGEVHSEGEIGQDASAELSRQQFAPPASDGGRRTTTSSTPGAFSVGGPGAYFGGIGIGPPELARQQAASFAAPADGAAVSNGGGAAVVFAGAGGGVAAAAAECDVPIASVVVPRAVEAVEAERVGCGTYSRDGRVRVACAAVAVLVACLALGLGISLATNDGGGGGESTEPTEPAGGEEGAAAQQPSGGGGKVGTDDECSRGYRSTCGECWCALDEADAATDVAEGTAKEPPSCPAYPEGWINGCTSGTSDLADMYASFELVALPEYLEDLPQWDGDSHRLVLAAGEECNPFLYHAGPPEDNPWSDLPPCYAQDERFHPFEAVCAFKFTEEVSSLDACRGRAYEMVTYQSWPATVAAGAHVSHLGPCGVCSAAHDLAAFLHAIDSFYEQLTVCGIESNWNNEADGLSLGKLQQCYTRFGLSDSCAMVYAIWTLGMHTFCHNECHAATQEDPAKVKYWLGGTPPTCEEHDCIKCTGEHLVFGLAPIIGRADVTSSITMDGRYPCSTVAALPRIDHDPCDNTR